MEEEKGNIRCFIGLDVGQDVRRWLTDIRDTLLGLHLGLDDPSWKWENPEDYDITVQFVGQVPSTTVPDLAEAIRKAAEETEPIAFLAEELGTFYTLPRSSNLALEQDGILWTKAFAHRKAFGELRRRLSQYVDPKPGDAASLNFVPHITLARFIRPLTKEQGGALFSLDQGPVQTKCPTGWINQVHLYQAHQGPEHQIPYTKLSTANLKTKSD